MNTFLRWAGSKRKLLPILLDVAPDNFDRYVEPFAGSACLFFALEPLSRLDSTCPLSFRTGTALAVLPPALEELRRGDQGSTTESYFLCRFV
ncbi:MAG: DNA adenine methylase [Acidobacteria bacterium]|nr:DNA adenine methylase [Acidobacteriota bacterium]